MSDIHFIVYETKVEDPLQPEYIGWTYRGKHTVKGDPFKDDDGYRGTYSNKELRAVIRQAQRNWGDAWKKYITRTTICTHKKEEYAFKSEANAVDYKYLSRENTFNKYRGGQGGIYGKRNPLKGKKLTQEHKDNKGKDLSWHF